MRIALVACCGQKLGHPAPAAELYTSPLFRKSVSYATTFDAWYILSAKYGLVLPTELIEPYDRTLLTMGKADRLAWGRKVLDQITEAGIEEAEFTALAGARYAEPLVRAGLRVDLPLKGLRIGEQLVWFTDRRPVAATKAP